MKQRLLSILLVCFVVSCATQTQPVVDNKWLDAPVAQQVAAMKRGELTAEALVAGYLARIESIDKSGPTINSILLVNPNALAEARAKDAALASGEATGPLHGIPVLLTHSL